MILLETTFKMSYWDLLMKGGWLMVPLLLLSVISIFILADRYFYIKNRKRVDNSFFEKFNELIKEGKVETAKDLCISANCSESRILLKGIEGMGSPVREIYDQMEREGKLEAYKYEGNMYFLGVIAGIAPMLGFIGTISGVIKIFYNISLADNISISLISGGLYEKLITSGVGLLIGIIAYLSYHILNHMVDRLVQGWEHQCIRFIDLIKNKPV
jgi:biopolymer transport protein ExbB